MPIALGAVLILAVVAVAVTTLAQSGESSARRMSAEQRAFALAESALERAIATLHAAADPAAGTAVPPGSEAHDTGTASWTGTLAGTTWTLGGTGTIPGEGGTGAVTRTVSARYTVSVADSPWEYLFAGNPAGCTSVAGGATVSAPLYVRGDLCLADGASYAGPSLHVEGTLSTAATGQVGAAGSPVAAANLVGGCTGGSPDPHACTSADRVWATTLTQTPGVYTKPSVDLDGWYAKARPGPSSACTSGSLPGGFDDDTSRNASRAPFDLTGPASYSCAVVDAGTEVGRLEWLPGSPGVLTVSGVVYFDGDVTSSGDAVYSGRGTVYSSGSILLSAGARLCGVAGCGAGWSPGAGLLVLVAGGDDFTIGSGAVYQGAAYARDDYSLGPGAQNWGPVVADTVSLAQDVVPTAALTTLPPGAPGIETTIHPVAGSWGG